MDLSYSPDEAAFQADVRAFLASDLPPEIATKVAARRDLAKADMDRWHAILHARGWLAGPWQTAFGK
jgi:hypothetical protein